MPALIAAPWLGTAIAGVAAGTGAIVGAKMQSGAATKGAQLQTDAANHAADVQAKAQADALAFSKTQAENTYLNNEATRKANYDQWASGQAMHNKVRAAYGYGTADVPAYVAGVDPRFTDPAAGAPPATGYVAQPGLPGYAPGTKVDPRTGQLIQPNTGIAGNAADVAASRGASAPGSVGSYLAQGPTTNVANAPIQPYDPRRVVPGSVGSYLR